MKSNNKQFNFINREKKNNNNNNKLIKLLHRISILENNKSNYIYINNIHIQ